MAVENPVGDRRHLWPLVGAFLFLLGTNLIWIAHDTRPPFWDMAGHQIGALKIHDTFAENGLGGLLKIPGLTAHYPLGFYPPFYHSVVAVFYAVFGKDVDSAQWANLPAIFILLIATYGIGKTLFSPFAAAAAAVCANFYPFMLWMSRETLVDYWLASLVALAIWVLLQTNEFSARGWSLLFGAVCGLGMLTKWTFPFFVVPAALWFARKNIKNAVLAGAVAAAIAAVWYVPAAKTLPQLFVINAAGAVAEGDPSRLSLQALMFYPRAMAGYQMFLPLFVAFVAGLVLVVRRFDRKWIPVLLWIGGGWLGLMLFQNKDPRYSAPMLAAAALVTAQLFDAKRRLHVLLLPLLLVQHYLVSFGIPVLPPAVVVAQGPQGPLSWNWNFYTQTYFGLWGPPAAEDWKIAHVLEAVAIVAKEKPEGAVLGIVPDIPRFDSISFEFHVALLKLPIKMNAIRTFDPERLASNDFILASARDQGWATNVSNDIDRIDRFLLDDSGTFQPIERLTLPDGNEVRLYRVRRKSE